MDLCKAGDDAIITGTVIQRWSPLTKGVRCEIELAIVANNVLVSDCWGHGCCCCCGGGSGGDVECGAECLLLL